MTYFSKIIKGKAPISPNVILLDFFIDDKSLYFRPTFIVSASLDLLKQLNSLKKIMLKGEWQMDSTAKKYLRKRVF